MREEVVQLKILQCTLLLLQSPAIADNEVGALPPAAASAALQQRPDSALRPAGRHCCSAWDVLPPDGGLQEPGQRGHHRSSHCAAGAVPSA